MSKLLAFLKDDSGAVTIDWVVLTAAVVGLGMVVLFYVANPVGDLARWIGYAIEWGGGYKCGAEFNC